MAVIMVAILDSTNIQYFNMFLDDTFAFIDSQNLDIDTKSGTYDKCFLKSR